MPEPGGGLNPAYPIHTTAALASVLLFLKFIELTLRQDTSLPSQNALAPDICMLCSFTSFWSQLKHPLMHEALLYYLQQNSKLPTPQHYLLPLSCLMFLHSTYHLLTYYISLVYFLVPSPPLPLEYKLNESKDLVI